MPIVPVGPPQPVPIYSDFDYVAVDAERRRVYAAHYGSEMLLIVNADAGQILGQVHVGPVDGLAVDPATGHVFTANGTWRTLSEVDGPRLKELRTTTLPSALDALLYDPSRHRLYVDEQGGGRIFVVDARTLRLVGTIVVPHAQSLEGMAFDPDTHTLYQTIESESSFAIIDTDTLRVRRIVSTAPYVTNNHPIAYDRGYAQILTGQRMLAAYDRRGYRLGLTVTQRHVDQCDLDQRSHLIACAGGGKITLFRAQEGRAPLKVAEIDVSPRCHNVAIDAATLNVWAVWASRSGDFIQRFAFTPAQGTRP